MMVKTQEGSHTFLPAGLVLVQRIGITRTEEVNNLTVDAAEVNPPQPAKSGKRPHKKGAK